MSILFGFYHGISGMHLFRLFGICVPISQMPNKVDTLLDFGHESAHAL